MNKLAMEVRFLTRRASRRQIPDNVWPLLCADIVARVADAATQDKPHRFFIDQTDYIREEICSYPIKPTH